jgi:hypothetical protein
MRIVVRMTMRTNLLLPRELVEEVDKYAGPRGRSRYVAEALAAKVKRDRMRSAFEGARGMWADHPLFPTAESVVEWVRQGRAEETYGPLHGPPRKVDP